MVRNIAFAVLFLLPSLTQAALESQFIFNGQNAETLLAQKKVEVIVQEEVQVPSMCSRRVPYQENVCRNETRYRQSCQTIPASRECSEVPYEQCRPVTRTTLECTGTPSRTHCVERPTREVCTTRPNGTRHCTTVGGGESCREIPGTEVCRNVSYQDSECTTAYRTQCETIPSRNECSQVPYEERVCGMETQYRLETYACTETQTITKKVERLVKSETSVQILTNGIVEEFPVKVSVIEKDASFSRFAVETKLLKEPRAFVVVGKQQSKVVSSTEKEIHLRNTVVLEVLTEEMLPLSFPSALAKATIDQKSSKLTLVFEGSISPIGSVSLLITHKALLRSVKTIAEFKGEYPSQKVELGLVGDRAALSIDLKENLKNALQSKNMLLKFELFSPLNLQGDILNLKKPSTSKLYQGTFVQLK